MLPLWLLTLLSGSTFAFEVDDFAGRSGNVATYFLAAFASASLSAAAPKVALRGESEQRCVALRVRL
jgi:hypothetical protein|eukprot:COSAG06_NODE_28885_length_566_cov_0.886510_2_plen_67_part_00